MATYTNISKPTGAAYTAVGKSPSDLPLYGIAIYGTSKYGQQDSYSQLSKPTGTPYISITKPT